MFDKYVRIVLKDTVIIYKRYDKYIIYNSDMKIINFLTEFKHLHNKISIDKNYINYILKLLRNNNINYIVIDIINSNDVINKQEFINNKYRDFLKKGKRYMKRRMLIDELMMKYKNYDINYLKRINNNLESFLC